MQNSETKFLPFGDAVDLIALEPCRLPSQYMLNPNNHEELYVFDERDEDSDGLGDGRVNLALLMLIMALKKGLVRAYGQLRYDEKNSNKMAPCLLIHPSFWSEAEVDVSDYGESYSNGEIEYQTVFVSGEDLDKLLGWWIVGNAEDSQLTKNPDDKEKSLQQVICNAKTEGECKRWISELAMALDVRKKKSLWEEAKSKFGESLSYRGFCRAWDAAAPASWKVAGRRNGKS